MKWHANQLRQNIQQNAADIPPLVLVYGDDSGLVRKLAKETAEKVCPDDDPFLVDRLSADDLKNTPSRLLESAQTMGFGSGQKLIQLDANHLDSTTQKATTDAVKSYLAHLESGAGSEGPASAVVVMSASGLDAKQAMVKAAEKSNKAAAVRCFLDSERDIGQLINEKLTSIGQTIAPDARQFLAEGLGRDRGVTESELEKLLLYTIHKKEITLEDTLEVVASAPSVNIFKLCDAIGLRDKKQTDQLLNRLHHEGVDPNVMLAMVGRHLRRLKACQDMGREGLSPQQAMGKLRPPVFMGKDIFQTQLQRTSLTRLSHSITRLYHLQEASRKGTADPALTVHRGLLALSA